MAAQSRATIGFSHLEPHPDQAILQQVTNFRVVLHKDDMRPSFHGSKIIRCSERHKVSYLPMAPQADLRFRLKRRVVTGGFKVSRRCTSESAFPLTKRLQPFRHFTGIDDCLANQPVKMLDKKTHALFGAKRQIEVADIDGAK